MKTLFIGGPADGRLLDVPDDRDWMSVGDEPRELGLLPLHQTDPFATYQVYDYRREQLQDKDGKRYSVMALPGTNVLLELLRGYRSCPAEQEKTG